jgi:hypothetical protein
VTGLESGKAIHVPQAALAPVSWHASIMQCSITFASDVNVRYWLLRPLFTKMTHSIGRRPRKDKFFCDLLVLALLTGVAPDGVVIPRVPVCQEV